MADDTRQPVYVFAHVHYPDVWAEMCSLLAERLTMPFRLVLTGASPQDLPVPATAHLQDVQRVATENRGRDIRPFLAAMAEAPDFAIGLKLHTKKSPQRSDGARWRDAMLQSLLPAGTAGTLVAGLEADPRIGLVAPQDFALSVAPWLLQNEAGLVRIAATLGETLVETDLEDCYFAAGSMFWFRRAAIARLAGPAVLELFEPELAQLDRTTAHAMERMFPVEAKRQGFVSLAVPALLASRPGMALPELAALARDHADVITPFFSRPGVPDGTLPPDLTPARPGAWLRRLWRARA